VRDPLAKNLNKVPKIIVVDGRINDWLSDYEPKHQWTRWQGRELMFTKTLTVDGIDWCLELKILGEREVVEDFRE
jgi:hypothetical protein